MNYNNLNESEKILSVLDKMGAVSPETAVTTEQMVGKGIELGMTKDVFTDNWHGHLEGDHPWWILLAAMSGTGSEEEVAKYNVPHLHRKKVKMVKNGRKTNVMVYWYDESYTHDINYTGKVYKEKLQREQDIKDLLDRTRDLPVTKEDRIAQMKKDSSLMEVYPGRFFRVQFILDHPDKFNPYTVSLAQDQINK